MAVPLVNVLVAPAAAQAAGLTGPPGAPAGPQAGTQSGAPKSFIAAMRSAENPHADGGSSPLLPADLAVDGAASTVPAALPDLALVAQPGFPITGERLAELQAELSDEVVSADIPTGIPLPVVTPVTGNILPPVTAQSESQPPVSSAGTATQMTPAEIILRQATTDPLPRAVADTTRQSTGADGQTRHDGATPLPAMSLADDSTALPPPTNPTAGQTPPGDMPDSGHIQRAFELMMHNDSAAANRTSATVDPATMIPDPGLSHFAQPAAQTPLHPAALMDAPQFQNMRPLQPMADPQVFTQGLGQRLMVMSEDGIQSARLKLHPENLGTLDVRIRVEHDTAQVWFTAHHGQAREALEAALPRLKEMFAQQGMNLIQADVGSGHEQHGSYEGFEPMDNIFSGITDSDSGYGVEPAGRANIARLSERSLDIYV